MTTSWLVGILLFVQYFVTIRHFDKAIDTNPTFHAHMDFFKTQTLLMYIQLGYFVAVLLAEVSCLWMFFATEVYMNCIKYLPMNIQLTCQLH